MSQAPGWYRDPFHREQERYWDGKIWTQGTRSEGADAPITDQPAPAAAGDANAAGAAGAALGRLTAALDQPASAEAPSFAPLGAPVRPTVAAPGAGAPSTGGTVATSGPGHRGRRRRGAMVGVSAAVFVLIVVGVSAALALGGGGGRSGQASAAEAVATAATQTINAHSADLSMSMTASSTGLDESLSATGSFDFAQKTGTMNVTIPNEGSQYSEQEILDGSTIYVNVSGLCTCLGLAAPSKPWVSMPEDQSDTSPTDVTTLDPNVLLHQLQSVGGSVTPLGQTGYDGGPATEYQATLPPSALESSMGALPSSSGQSMNGVDMPVMTVDIYVTQDDLLKALVVPTYSFDIFGQTLSVQMTLAFSNYGTTVTATPPPPDQVQTFQEFVGGLGNSGSTGNTGNSGVFGNSGSTGNTGSSGCGCPSV